MPIHIPPVSRRAFLASTAAGVASLAIRPAGADSKGADPNRFALLADTHVPANAMIESTGANMTKNMQSVIAQLIALDVKPAAVIVNGDCAFLKGLPADYANLAGLVAPLAEAGLPLHLTMGNHDDREPLYDAISAQRPEHPPVESKHVAVIESQHANWFLLDSLMATDVVTGELGEAQRKWLAIELDRRKDKPAIVVAHHNPQFTAPANGGWNGLKDATELFELLDAREHVKAYIFGHTHQWILSRRGRLQLINLPPVAYVFSPKWPNGWVDAQLRADGIDLTLVAHDHEHPQHGEKTSLNWS